ncbi:CHAT domain-containing protein [Phormidium sp. CLA17]|uniref:CHAT domain-containing protein n=1 Tax=Leptolyngbya sp. Cla-17 TaxID=2803751 RepID=UPI00149282CD|nr:CHAT domain-containing protein [Leptolyngbya sp. Cla-17]MBM0744577.1 CHAT domain-containing protein [Leptolyngbya sp. Cla-17]
MTKLLRRGLLWLTAFLLSIILSNHLAIGQTSEATAHLLRQSRQRYEAGQLNEARALLQQVQQQAQGQENGLALAIALSNLALIDSEQGNWTGANREIAASLQTLQTTPNTSEKSTVLTQVLNVQGRLQLAQGDAQAALQTWKRTALMQRQLGNINGEIQSQVRQSQALQAMGLHSRAYQEILLPLQDRLQQPPESSVKAAGLRSVGEAIGIVGNLITAQEVTQKSLAMAQRLKNPLDIAASQLTLANLLYAKIRETRSIGGLRTQEQQQIQSDTNTALNLYEQIASTPSPNQLRAQLNRLALLIEINSSETATELAATLQPEILALPPTRPGIEARLNFANSSLRLQKLKSTVDLARTITLLTTTVEQARNLNDARLIANALGNLGRSQELSQQFGIAQTTTEQAVLMAKAANAPEQTYRWLAQLGRLQEQQGKRAAATQSYTQAVTTLRTLRSDLLGINAETQLVDQETLEPVHRQLISLLLPKDNSQPDRDTLRRTREVIESLQLEEINNYLRAACFQSQIEIDKILVPQKTAIVYPIILPDRIAIIVSAAGQETRLYNQPVSQPTVATTVRALQDGLRNRISLEFRQPSKQLYEWLITPIEAELQRQKVETIVFVLDGVIRNIPMAALFDGKQFLIEKYSLATTPGLKLTSPQPLQAKALSGVAFGLTESRTVTLPGSAPKSFSELPFVQPELEDLQREIRPSTVQLNAQFTRDQFQQTLQKSQAPIVHLATHGQFSSDRDQTFLLASDGVIGIDQLAIALSSSGATRTTPIELLVLSACETASGDDRAPLGLAGIALKSGARSTVASLWKVSDAATSQLMQRFYKELATRQVSKADALQRAQRSILDDPQFRRHPYYWAPFILVGNWL